LDPCLHVSRAELHDEAPPGAVDEVRFTESLVEAVLAEYSREGDIVLDPFAGYGTTAVVAARMGRMAIAVELLPERAELIRERVGLGAQVITGDARSLAAIVAGPIDLCLTSPPYMAAAGHPENPLTGYRSNDGDYRTYLDELEEVTVQIVGLLRPGGHLVINVADIESGGVVTPLSRDVSERVARHAELVREIHICWDEPPTGILDDRCMVFSARTPR
jgi:DNA modification methylase